MGFKNIIEGCWEARLLEIIYSWVNTGFAYIFTVVLKSLIVYIKAIEAL